MRNFAAFLRRRFQPNEPFGLPLTLGLAVSLTALEFFLVILSAIPSGGAPTEFDQQCADAMQEQASAHPGIVPVFRLVTRVGGVPAMVALAVLGGALLTLRKHWLLAAGWVIAAAAGGLLNYGLKKTIDRP